MGKVNAMKENYQKILDETIAGLEEKGEVFSSLCYHHIQNPMNKQAGNALRFYEAMRGRRLGAPVFPIPEK